MKSTVAAALLLVNTLTGSQAFADEREFMCIAKVLYSEETPFAPIDDWFAKVTLQITAPDGRSFETTVHKNIRSQTPPPRQGQTFKVRCDPANPADLHNIF